MIAFVGYNARVGPLHRYSSKCTVVPAGKMPAFEITSEKFRIQAKTPELLVIHAVHVLDELQNLVGVAHLVRRSQAAP